MVTIVWFIDIADRKMASAINPKETKATPLRVNELPFILINLSLTIPNKKAARIPDEYTNEVAVFI